MNMLLAGGAGFIGSHLADALIEEGHKVICVDNFYLGTKENIKHLHGNDSFKFYEVDLDDLDKLKEVFEAENIDYVFHLAANSDIKASAKCPTIELQNTMLTTFNLLECMRLYNVKNLFFASTSAVYGEKIEGPMNELAGPLEPISYYGAAKLASEAFITAFTHMNNLNVLVFRFPNVIGSRLTHGVIYDFINKLKNDSTQLEILGDGTQCKPYMHVLDLVKGMMMIKDNLPEGVSTYNIGVETQTTVTQIANIICKEMGLTNVKYNYTGGNIGWKGDVPTFKYNLEKIYAKGWKSTMTSDETVVATVREVL